MNKEIEKNLQKVFKKVFNITNENYENFSEREETQWDSLKGVNLLLEIEKKFSIKISTSDLQKFNSFKNIKKILNKQINEK